MSAKVEQKGDIPGSWRYVTVLPGLVSAIQVFVVPRVFSPGEVESKAGGGPSTTPGGGPGLSPVSEADEGEPLTCLHNQASANINIAASPLLASPSSPLPESQLSVRELLSNTSLRGPTLLCAAIMCLQQFSGVNAVMFYSTPVLKPLMPSSAGMIGLQITFVNAVMTIVAIFLIDVSSSALRVGGSSG
jgi:SP family facilitated glucose transporter-like MFS transporter 3